MVQAQVGPHIAFLERMYKDGKTVTYQSEKGFSIHDVERLLLGQSHLKLSAESLQKTERCFIFLRESSTDKVIYGINTGFGPMAEKTRTAA